MRTVYTVRTAFLTGAMLVAMAAGRASADGATATADCGACRGAVAQALAVDPSSYKLWPSGARTVVDVVWLPQASRASFGLINIGTMPTSPITVSVAVDNHDPLSQTSIGSSAYSYSVAGLAPQALATITVPLDFTQCDVFLTLDLGSGTPLVFRTGNPAAC